MTSETHSRKDAIVGWSLMGCATGAAYLASHDGGHGRAGVIGACCALASGFVWAVSASLPARRRGLATKANFIAAGLAAMSAVCLLP